MENESLLDRIPRHERSGRFWGNTRLILATIVLSVLTTGATLFFVGRKQLRDSRIQEVQAELEAEVQAELEANVKKN
jgi:hypothetical protein